MLQKDFWRSVCVFLLFCDVLYALDEEQHATTKSLKMAINIKNQPVPVARVKLDAKQTRNFNCESFADYALNCTMNAALMYNSYKKSPPMPNKIQDWCRAIKYLTNCALEWNLDCRDVTDSHFNEESINGHSYVVHNICDDNKFVDQYSNLKNCVNIITEEWEACYTVFKSLVDGFKKNTSAEWTHYETHFYLCCGRARFRRCILDHLYSRSNVCNREQSITLQKFSVIVSEGDVYQDCDFNLVYENCPGGDPRPKPGDNVIAHLAALSPEFQTKLRLSDKGVHLWSQDWVSLWIILMICNIFL